jgi:signal transduction histidine kinase
MTTTSIERELGQLRQANSELKSQVEQLLTMNRIAFALGTTQDFDTSLKQLAAQIAQYTGGDQIVVLVADEQDANLIFGGASSHASDKQPRLESIRIPLEDATEPIVVSWKAGQPYLAEPIGPTPSSIVEVLEVSSFYTVPLIVENSLIGVLIVDNPNTGAPPSEITRRTLVGLADSAAIALQNARLHHKTVQELADNMREMYILRQIDKELNENIDLNRVFEMTLDWALRFTHAQYASLALYHESTDELRFIVDYGYDIPPEQIADIRKQNGAGIVQRVARSGYSEVVPDVSMDKDYVRIAGNTRSQLCMPVMREDGVIAVISLESRKLNGFTEAHLDFVAKLANRAGVAIDNARLLDEAVREREKLSHILSNTADVVIVVGTDGRLMLINEAALAALRLYPNERYEGRQMADIFTDSPLLDVYEHARQQDENRVREVVLPSGRIFHTSIKSHDGIGWIIVMHDITPFKEMDRLKTELIQTVSHDLKQPLGVMNGYIELLMMQQAVAQQGMNGVNMIRRAIQNMRQLIDDLLDMAKIESGIKLNIQPLSMSEIVAECVETIQPNADNKSMTIQNEVSDDLPLVLGDHNRLVQIFTNLIGNGVKYTPPSGTVHIYAEVRGNNLRVSVQDNGMGISPEDQVHVFDRFYRVRRPETDGIEGTGLGLAIVKSLVEGHNGEIGLESRLGEGSTFYVTLPLALKR